MSPSGNPKGKNGSTSSVRVERQKLVANGAVRELAVGTQLPSAAGAVPAGHGEHGEPAGACDPSGHGVHAAAPDVPSVEVLAGHGVQVARAAELPAEKVLGGHAVQSPGTSLRTDPGWQLGHVQRVLQLPARQPCMHVTRAPSSVMRRVQSVMQASNRHVKGHASSVSVQQSPMPRQ